MPSTTLALDRPRSSPMRDPLAPTTIAMPLPAGMTPCAPKVWNAIRPLATFSFDPWNRPTSETPARTASTTNTIGRAPLAEVEHEEGADDQ